MPARLLTEAVGTFFLVLTIGLVSISPGAGELGPIAVGLVLVGLIQAGGPISAAHYNPAVTLAFLLRRGVEPGAVAPYVLAQLAAAAAGAGAALLIKGEFPVAAGPAGPAVLARSLLAEALFTFLLAAVILFGATSAATRGNPLVPVAVGATVAAGAYSVGNISGASFNPAVTGALVLWGFAGFADAGVHLAGQAAGAVAAGVLYRFAARAGVTGDEPVAV